MTMQAVSWRHVDLASVALAGLAAGYVMAIIGLWPVGPQASFRSTSRITAVVHGVRSTERMGAWPRITSGEQFPPGVCVASLVQPNIHWPRPLEGLLWGIILA
jgi:hypothetical protein